MLPTRLLLFIITKILVDDECGGLLALPDRGCTELGQSFVSLQTPQFGYLGNCEKKLCGCHLAFSNLVSWTFPGKQEDWLTLLRSFPLYHQVFFSSGSTISRSTTTLRVSGEVAREPFFKKDEAILEPCATKPPLLELLRRAIGRPTNLDAGNTKLSETLPQLAHGSRTLT